MPRFPSREIAPLIHEAQVALHLSQQGLGELLGAVRRTVSRWGEGVATPTGSKVELLARTLYPVDPGLAARVAATIGETPASLGLEVPVLGPPSAPLQYLVDTIVCAALEVADVSPRAMRPALLAAFERAQVVGLSVEAVVKGLGDHGGSVPG